MLKRIFSSLGAASSQSGRSPLSLAAEMIRLRISAAKLGISEYFDFQLYLSDLTHEEKCRFGGWRLQSVLEEILADDYALFLSLDKITMYTLLDGYSLPIPKLRAAYLSQRPSALKQIGSAEQLADYLQQPEATPVYIKPSYGAYGRGNTLVRGANDGTLTLGDNTSIKTIDFCKSLKSAHALGWVLQEPLVPHPSIAKVCGSKISGIRVHTFLSAQGPILTKAIWKINVGKEDSDNFQHGASGNMLAALDLETGRVIRVVAGTGPTQVINPTHPVTGAQFTDFCMPWWQEIKALACNAQLAFPGFICPGWDIAVCEDGLKILEVNSFGDIDLSQHAYRVGFLDESFIAMMRGRSLDKLLHRSSGVLQRSPKNQRLGIRKHHWDW